MFHVREHLLPYNMAAKARGASTEMQSAIAAHLRQCDCDHGPTPCSPVDGKPATFLLGVSQGSSVTIGSDGVFIGACEAPTAAADGERRILAAWDADGHVLERVDALGHVPDPHITNTMNVSYDSPNGALYFKVRDHKGELKTMVLGGHGVTTTAVSLRPVDAMRLVGADRVTTETDSGVPIPALRFPVSSAATVRGVLGFALYGIPRWAGAVGTAYGIDMALALPPATDAPIGVRASFGGSSSAASASVAEGSVRFRAGHRGATVVLTVSPDGFVVCTDGVRRPRCPAGLGDACVQTLTLELLWDNPPGTRRPIDIVGVQVVLYAH
jgi:hypothetical protein